ncbi:MAG TPA: pitrilysin family protein [Cytophagales bacterium]|nr:pitrilysin family protein [Cytophagales bacterium]
MDRTIAPSIKPLKDFDLQQAEKIVLSNGIHLYAIDSGEQPLVRLEVVFEAGTKYESKPGVSFITSKMLQEGTRHFTAAEIQEKIAALGAFMEVHHGAERINYTFYLLTKYLDEFLVILEEMLLRPTFPRENFESTINIALNNIRVNIQKNSVLASQEFKKLLYGEKHSYGYSVQEEDLNVITLYDVTNHFYTHMLASDFEVFVAGMIDPTTMERLQRFFEGIGNAKKPRLRMDDHGMVKNQRILVAKPEALQSSIRIGKVLFNRAHEDYFSAFIANEILGGYFGSRLMRNIREEKGLTYGISSQLVSQEDSGYFVIGTDVKRENTQLALDEIYKEVEVIKNEPISTEELETVTSYMHGSYLGSINSAFAIMDKFKTLHYAGLAYTYYTDYIHTLRTITAVQVQDVASKYFSDLNEVVVGDYQ